MSTTIHSSILQHSDPEATLAFYCDVLGFELRNDVGYSGMRWLTVGLRDQPDTSVVLSPVEALPGVTDEERGTIEAMMAKGTFGMLLLATDDLDATFERLRTSHCEIVEEPTDQPYGIRDGAVRDPSGNLIKIQQRQ